MHDRYIGEMYAPDIICYGQYGSIYIHFYTASSRQSYLV